MKHEPFDDDDDDNVTYSGSYVLPDLFCPFFLI